MQNVGTPVGQIPTLGQIPIRSSVATEIKNHADRLAVHAEDLAKRVEDKLSSVMTGAQPNTGKEINQLQACPQALPPLFASLNNSLVLIESALGSIERALLRTEL